MARWLNRAGAEARLGYVLAAGSGAIERMVDELDSHSIEVQIVRTTVENPVPQAIRNHVGNHFNSTLYLIDGLEDGELLDNIAQLELLREQVVKDGNLGRFDCSKPFRFGRPTSTGPGLMRMMMHCCLYLGDLASIEACAGAPVSQIKQWRRAHRTRDCVFNTILTQGAQVDYWDYTRVVQSGYGTALIPPANSVADRLNALWRSEPVSVREHDDAAVLEAAMRHYPDACRGLGVGQVVDRLGGCFLPLDSGFSGSGVGLVRAFAGMDGDVGQTREDALRLALSSHTPSSSDVQLKVEMVVAQLCAGQDDIEGCRSALEKALEIGASGAVTPEFVLGALETTIRFYTLIGERGRARDELDTMERWVRTHGSPFYFARLQRALGSFLMPIDPRRACHELLAAEQIFRSQGYDSWSQETVELAEACRR